MLSHQGDNVQVYLYSINHISVYHLDGPIANHQQEGVWWTMELDFWPRTNFTLTLDYTLMFKSKVCHNILNTFWCQHGQNTKNNLHTLTINQPFYGMTEYWLRLVLCGIGVGAVWYFQWIIRNEAYLIDGQVDAGIWYDAERVWQIASVEGANALTCEHLSDAVAHTLVLTGLA